MTHELIDAHHHLWSYREEEYPWMSAQMDILRRDYLVEDLSSLAQQYDVTGTVAVQARQSIEETNWLLSLAEANKLIRGVVGWVPLVDPSLKSFLDQLGDNPKLKGLRHVLHDEPDDHYMLRRDFNQGIALIRDLSLVYDILIFEKHLPQTISFVDLHPDQIFVIDHIAKPRIAAGEISPWRENIGELAKRQNVYCKLSGVVTEAGWHSWSESQLRPYFDTVLAAFGPSRLMFGSDWPVLNLASSYGRWLEAVKHLIANLSPDEQRSIFSQTAIKVYGL